MAGISLRLPERSGEWWKLARLKALFPPEALPLGHLARPGEFGFLAVNTPVAQRSVVVLENAVVAFDLPLTREKPAWSLEGKAEVRPVPLDCGALLHVAGQAAPLEKLESLDLAGVRIGARAVLFRIEATMARDAVSYVVEGSDPLAHLVTGVAPGWWQILWNGWLEDTGMPVEPREGALSFTGPAGSYFFRRR
jgi:hypothetical protein